MDTMIRHAVTTAETATSPSSNRLMTTLSIIHRTPSDDPAVQKANTAAPDTAIAKEPGWSLTRDMMRRKPRRSWDVPSADSISTRLLWHLPRQGHWKKQ